MKEIKLSCARACKNRGKFVALVDDEDYKRVNQFTWNALKVKNNTYARRNFKLNGKWKTQYLHHFILGQEKQINRSTVIDHINHDSLDNRRSNIRICTQSQNCMNMRVHKNGTSIYRGVCWKRNEKKWSVQIMINGIYKHIGYFHDEIEAAISFDKAAIEYFGEYAFCNFHN